MTEDEYWGECRLLSHEIDVAAELFFTYEEINRLAWEDQSVFRALNSDAHFWNIQKNALLTTLFIVLGRIFDVRPGAHSIHKVVRLTHEHPEFFSPEKLAARKSPGGVAPQWLDDYLADVPAHDPSDIRDIKKELARRTQIFEDTYRPIRHQVFAHRIMGTDAEVRQLFERTDREQLKEIISFLCELISAIWHLYQNGRKPELDLPPSPGAYAEQIRASTRSVLNKLATFHNKNP